jgi:hypothetical protein
MPPLLDPRLDILPTAQKEIWPDLSAAPRLSLVLYGGTAVALHLGHRQSVIAAMIAAGVSLSTGLGAFKKMFNGYPSHVLRAIGYFKDGDLHTLAKADQDLLRNARDQVIEVPDVQFTPGTLAIASSS